MKELVGFPGEATRNSLTFTRLTFRTFSTAVSDCLRPLAVHEARATRSPLKAAGPEVILNAAVTLAPGATGSGNVFGATAVQPFGTAMLSSTPAAVAVAVFLKVTVVSWDDPGENVCTPGGAAAADAGATLSRATSYLAATTLAWTSWSVAFVGNVPPA